MTASGGTRIEGKGSDDKPFPTPPFPFEDVSKPPICDGVDMVMIWKVSY